MSEEVNVLLDKEAQDWLQTHLPSDMLHVRSSNENGVVRFVAWLNGRPVGEMKVTVLPLVHDMEIEASLVQRKIADALFGYASGYVRASGFSEALVLVADTNDPMQRYVEARSTPEEASKAYFMDVK